MQLVDVSRRPAPSTTTGTPRLRAALLVLTLVLSALVGTAAPASAHHTSSSTTTGPSYSMEDQFLSLLNSSRRAAGKKALRRVSGVNNVAREWSHVMAVDGTLKHRRDLRAPFDGRWERLAENVGVGYSASSLHVSFMNSSGHRANILGDFDSVGIGVALAGARVWVTLNFVKGDPHTTSRYRSDPLAGGYATGAGSSGRYYDIHDNTFEPAIKELDAADVAAGCATSRYCPLDALRRSEMAVLLARALELPRARERFRDVPSDHPFGDEIGALAAAGITLGCNPPDNDRFCPEERVSRDQMASFFARALDLSPQRDRFRDVASDNVHWRNIGALAASGITRGCNPPANDEYCPRQDVTRGQMASFIARGVDL